MALGEAIRQNFKVIKNNPSGELVELELPKSTVNDCCFTIPVLAKATGGDNYTDDQSSVLWWYDNGFTNAVLNLQKYENGAWSEVANLNDNTYGTYYQYGFEINDKEESLLGYLIDWKLVLNALGEGTYRVQTEESTVLGDTVNRYSIEWCLQTYTQYRANRTVRIDWYNIGIVGSLTNDKDTRDYGSLNWFNQLRLPDAIFGDATSTYEREFVRYQNGKQVWIQDDSVEEYTLNTGRYPSYLHTILKFDLLQSDAIFVTNYDKNAAQDYVDKEVIASSDYSPNWNYGTKLADVSINFQQKYQNHRSKRC
jgi:hypothetical protein